MRKKFVRAPYTIASGLFKDGVDETTARVNSASPEGRLSLLRNNSLIAQPVASPSLLDADSARRRGSTTMTVAADEWPDDDGSPLDDDYDDLFGILNQVSHMNYPHADHSICTIQNFIYVIGTFVGN